MDDLHDSCGELVQETLHTPGWKIIEKWIKDRLASDMESIIVCPMEEVQEKRIRIKAYRSLLCKIHELEKEN